jgi:hypothetical protein
MVDRPVSTADGLEQRARFPARTPGPRRGRSSDGYDAQARQSRDNPILDGLVESRSL